MSIESNPGRLRRVARSIVLRTVVLMALLLSIGGALAAALIALRKEPPRREVTALPVLVDTEVLHACDVTEQFIGYGTAQPVRRANLAAEVPATVVERVGDIRAGSAVAEGQVLIRLDSREYHIALDGATARVESQEAALAELAVEELNLHAMMKTAEQELRIARDEKARVTGLFEQGVAAKKEYDFASLAYQQARRMLQGYEREVAKMAPRRLNLEATKRSYEADAALTLLNVERCEIRAPWGGQIDQMLVEAGDRVGPGTPVLTLIDSSHIEIPIELPAASYDRVRVGTPCKIVSESAAGSLWTGEVARVAPAADEQTRTFAAYIIVDNTRQSRPLVPGTFARAEVRGLLHLDAIVIPRSACRNGQVFVVEDGVARRRVVTPKRYLEERMIVSGELHDADRLILSHLDRLIDGTLVRLPALTATSSPKPPPGQQDDIPHEKEAYSSSP